MRCNVAPQGSLILPKAGVFINRYRLEPLCTELKTLQCGFPINQFCALAPLLLTPFSWFYAGAGAPIPMKLHATSTQQYQTVTAYDEAGVEINLVRYTASLVVMPEVPPMPWPVDGFDRLGSEHFAQIDAAAPDVVILGTGARQRFVHPTLISVLTARRIGVECMSNQAACRTYNILMAEGRKVALALIFDVAGTANA